MSEKQIKKELNREAVLFEDKVKKGKYFSESQKFESAAEEFFKQVEIDNSLKLTTIERYKDLRKRTYEAIGHMRLDKITPRKIQLFINDLAKDGVNKNTGKGLSTKTQKLYIGFISDVYKFVEDSGVYINNPCEHVRAVKIDPKEIVVFNIEESQRFINLLCEKADLKYKAFYIIAIFTGFRNGEILGLEWSDIDFENRLITISRTAIYSKEKGHITGTPKTKNGFRCLKVTEPVIDVIKELKADQEKRKEILGDEWHEIERLFTAYNGKPMGTGTPRYWLSKFCKRENFPEACVHSFRHFNASVLIHSGCNEYDVSKSLGHGSITTTMNIYVEDFRKAHAKASTAMADAISLKVDS